MLKVAFVCIHNSCRSIMAEGWANHLAKDVFKAYSAGTVEYPGPKEMAIDVMTDLNIDMSFASSKLLSDLPEIDVLITMGCGVDCPTLPCKHREDWGLTDPSGGTKYDFEKTRDLIREKILLLIDRINNGELK